MKKHFLLITLFALMFLGLGNYSHVAAADCTGNETGSVIPGGGCVCIDGFKRVKGVCKNCNLPEVCCGVELNTNVPFIGKCLEDQAYSGTDATVVSQEEAFPVLMGSLTQILVTVILIISFVLIVIGGIMISTGNPKGGKDLIMKVVIGIALLGASGVILRLINPNFFG